MFVLGIFLKWVKAKKQHPNKAIHNTKMRRYKVLQVIDQKKLVINGGKKAGLREGQEVVIYRFTDEDIVDIDTGKNYGKLEYLLGYGKISGMVQEDLCVVIPGDKVVRTPSALWSLTGISRREEEPWDSTIRVGDLVRAKD